MTPLFKPGCPLLLALLGLSPGVMTAQQAQQPVPQTVPAQAVTVTTTIEPLPLSESNRSVEVLNPRDRNRRSTFNLTA